MLDDITRSVEQPGPSLPLYTHTVGHAGTAITSQQHLNRINAAQIHPANSLALTKSLQASSGII